MHKVTHKQPHKHEQKKKKNTYSLVAIFLPNTKSKLNCHSLRLQIDTSSSITLTSQGLWKTISQPPLTSIWHIAWSASGDGVLITGKLPATMEIENKTASGKIYKADSRQNLLGLDFIKSLGLLDMPFNSVSNAIFRSPAQCSITEQTDDIIKPPPSFYEWTLKLPWRSNHLLHLFSDLNDQYLLRHYHWWTGNWNALRKWRS